MAVSRSDQEKMPEINLNDLFAQKDTSGQVEAIKEVFREDGVKMKSEVNPSLSEAEYFTKLFILSEVLRCPLLHRYADTVLQLRVSNLRKGRVEAVDMVRGTQPVEQRKGLLGWFK